MKQFIMLILLILSTCLIAQDYGDFPKIEKDRLLRDLELLYQGLDEYHTGMYWYTTKDSVERAFDTARSRINKDINELEFHKIIAPLVALSNEDHTDIFLNKSSNILINTNATYLPLFIVFLGDEMYCLENGSNVDSEIVGKKIVAINGETPKQIVGKIGNLFSSDGYIEQVKYSDLRNFKFSRYYYYYYGNVPSYVVEFEESTVEFEALNAKSINGFLAKRNVNDKVPPQKDCLEFKLINDSTAYIGIHDFDNGAIKENEIYNNLKTFLNEIFGIIKSRNIHNVILDLTQNGGGSEGNESLVYSYFGENYKKYHKVKAKTQKAVLDNGIDKPITLTTFGFFERVFYNKKMNDGSYERKAKPGKGLMAYKKEPKHKFKGDLYVLISPITYSGSSELSNMLYTNKLGTFVGQETGGGYYGNTSGYSEDLTLPHSEITIRIPALQFIMNVDDSIPFGRGVIPHHRVSPTFEQYVTGENAPLNFTLDLINKAKE